MAWSVVDFATVPTSRSLVDLHIIGPPAAMMLCALNRERFGSYEWEKIWAGLSNSASLTVAGSQMRTSFANKNKLATGKSEVPPPAYSHII